MLTSSIIDLQAKRQNLEQKAFLNACKVPTPSSLRSEIERKHYAFLDGFEQERMSALGAIQQVLAKRKDAIVPDQTDNLGDLDSATLQEIKQKEWDIQIKITGKHIAQMGSERLKHDYDNVLVEYSDRTTA